MSSVADSIHQSNQPASKLAPGSILHDRGQRYYWTGQANLSIKTFYGGQAHYTIGHARYLADDTSYLIVNHNQPYTITLEAEHVIESFCLFLRPGFVEEVHRSLTTPSAQLLDQPAATYTSLHFFERTYPHDALLSPRIFQLRAALSQQRSEPSRLYEQFYDLAVRLLQVHRNVYKEVEALPAVRAATREEQYRRIYYAREYIAAFFDQPLTLSELANVATLSPTHFLRLFKQVFQQTPHQYLVSKRLERARHLLATTDRPVTEICFDLGFESLGSFSSLFHQRVGCSPSCYRVQKR